MASISGNLGVPSASRARETTLPITNMSGLQRQLVGAEAFDQVDAERAQLVAHRRVDAGVAAGHAVAGFARQRGQAAHEGAADAENVNVHRADSREAF